MMLAWQDWIVSLIVILCVGRVGLSLWNLYKKTKQSADNPCTHCSQPCDIKRLYDQKKENCCLGDKKTKKSCCE
jgi:hypothetical protein